MARDPHDDLSPVPDSVAIRALCTLSPVARIAAAGDAAPSSLDAADHRGAFTGGIELSRLGPDRGRPGQRRLCRAASGTWQGRARPCGEGPVKLDPTQHPWMTAPETRAVFEALGNDKARFVGGSVRN